MPRPKRIYSDVFPYHVSTRCINREWFGLPRPVLWNLFEDYLYGAHHFYGLLIHAFMLMDNHFHLLSSTPGANIDEVMRYFLTETSREISRMTGRINQTYGGPYRASLINNMGYYHHAYKYLYRNPVKAGICPRVEDYPYSTLRGVLGLQKCIIPMVPDFYLFDTSTEQTLAWLNTANPQETDERIRKGLHRSAFAPSIDRHRRKNDFNASALPKSAAHLLFDGDGFGEVAGLVDVVAEGVGDVVGQKLQGDHFQQGQREP
jgi:REP element-mobilizing transposase RayT